MAPKVCSSLLRLPHVQLPPTLEMAALQASLQVGEACCTGHAACTACAAAARPDSVVTPCAWHAVGTWARAPAARPNSTTSSGRLVGRMLASSPVTGLLLPWQPEVFLKGLLRV